MRKAPFARQILRQLYSHFLHWDGSYELKKGRTTQAHYLPSATHTLHLTADLTQLQVRDEYTELIHTFIPDENTPEELKEYYRFKYEKPIILFSPDKVYNYWTETRFIEKGEKGILLRFTSCDWGKTLPDILKKGDHYLIRELSETTDSIYYSRTEKPYTLEGGLKLSRDTWMLGATPILTFKSPTDFWFNGIRHTAEANSLTWRMHQLEPGDHILKLPHTKPYEFKISTPVRKKQTDFTHGWKLHTNRDTPNWAPSPEANIIGADFGPLTSASTETHPLTRWIRQQVHPIRLVEPQTTQFTVIQLNNTQL